MRKFQSKSISQSFKIADRFSKILNDEDTVAFYGKLGSGKTTFIKRIAKNFGVPSNKVSSSSFVILREYNGNIPIFHVDLYRLNSRQIPDEVYECVYEKKGLVLIEWADKIRIDREHYKVSIDFLSLNERKISIKAEDYTKKKLLKKI